MRWERVSFTRVIRRAKQDRFCKLRITFVNYVPRVYLSACWLSATRVDSVIYVIHTAGILCGIMAGVSLGPAGGVTYNTGKLGRKEVVFNSFRRKLIPANCGAWHGRRVTLFSLYPIMNYFTASRDSATPFSMNLFNDVDVLFIKYRSLSVRRANNKFCLYHEEYIFVSQFSVSKAQLLR